VLHAYADGSGSERVGRPGGWAFTIVRDDEVLAEGRGSARRTSSLLMEFEAARAALEEVAARGWAETHQVHLVTDCLVAVDVAEGRFLPKPRLPAEAAKALRAAALRCRAAGRWVKAHAGDRWNERVDGLARAARLQGPG
jgi:ribonuclease HI